jgi:polyribonucleotide 5'-hydroxyl-kinase
MHVYTNLASALQEKREQARLSKAIGPRLMITGAAQSGKSTLCRILVNYAVKLGWSPILVDLDINSD